MSNLVRMPLPPIPSGVVNGAGLRDVLQRYHEALARTISAYIAARAPVRVTAATAANPIAITASGFSVGELVTFSGMPGAYGALNGVQYTLGTGLTIPVNGAAFGAYAGGGTVHRI